MKIFRSYLIVIVIGAFLFVILILIQQHRKSPYKIIILPPHKSQPLKTILFWTPFFSSTDFEFGLGNKPFIDHQCEIQTCTTTINRRMLNVSDAVVFHLQNLHSDDLPSHRSLSQRWIFYMLEPPTKTRDGLSRWNGFFNWTMTYRMDSDIFNPYGRFTAQQLDRLARTKNYASGKTKQAVWFASNCYTPGMRERYVQELRKYISVDVFGDCGNLSCPITDRHQCLQEAAKAYKFYLSFENCLCKDYVTEKMFDPLTLDIVPVVFGGGNYSKLSPPNSVINSLDFASPKDLAKYLNLLDENDELYNNYLKWKGKYQVKPGFAASFCDLCKKLHEPNIPSKVYDNLEKWWLEEANCSSASDVLQVDFMVNGFYWFVKKWEKL